MSVANVKTLLGLSDQTQDALIALLYDQAEEEAKEFTHREDVSALDHTIEQMAVVKFNRLGTEGAASESYEGTSYSYASDYPEGVLRALKAYRKLVVV